MVLAHVKHAECGFISQTKTIFLRLSEPKQKKRQGHSIRRNRLFRAAPIFFLIIITNTIVLAIINTNLHERKDATQPGSVFTFPTLKFLSLKTTAYPQLIRQPIQPTNSLHMHTAAYCQHPAHLALLIKNIYTSLATTKQ